VDRLETTVKYSAESYNKHMLETKWRTQRTDSLELCCAEVGNTVEASKNLTKTMLLCGQVGDYHETEERATARTCWRLNGGRSETDSLQLCCGQVGDTVEASKNLTKTMLLRKQVGDYHETQRRELHHVHFGDQMEAAVKHTCYSYVVDKSETQWRYLKT